MTLMLLTAACHKPDAATRDAAQAIARERIEILIAAPGMGPAQIESQIVQPIEVAVSSTPSLRHITAEADEARARVWLELEPGQREAAMVDLRARLNELVSTLPSELDPPVLRTVDGPGSEFVRWAIESETVDTAMMSELHDELIVRVEQIAGVFDVQTCAQRSRVVIELDPERLRAYAIDPTQVEAALRGSVDVPILRPAMPDIDGLRRTVIAVDPQQGTSVALGDVAAIRYGTRQSTCVAAGALGLVAAASVTVRDRSTAIAVEQLLDDAATRLPAGTRLRRFGSSDTTIELSVAADRELAEVAESIGSGLVRLSQTWLLEVGVASEPCVGVGTRVRLSVAGGEPVSLASFQSIPGVSHVRLLGAPNQRRLWLLGPDPHALHQLAKQEETRLLALPGLVGLDVYTEAPRSELQVEPDRAALAALGITTSELARQLARARGEIEVAELTDARWEARAGPAADGRARGSRAHAARRCAHPEHRGRPTSEAGRDRRDPRCPSPCTDLPSRQPARRAVCAAGRRAQRLGEHDPIRHGRVAAWLRLGLGRLSHLRFVRAVR